MFKEKIISNQEPRIKTALQWARYGYSDRNPKSSITETRWKEDT